LPADAGDGGAASQDAFKTEEEKQAQEEEIDDLLANFKTKGNVRKARKNPHGDVTTMYPRDAHHTPAEQLLAVRARAPPKQCTEQRGVGTRNVNGGHRRECDESLQDDHLARRKKCFRRTVPKLKCAHPLGLAMQLTATRLTARGQHRVVAPGVVTHLQV
jgi:hypothetical protein